MIHKRTLFATLLTASAALSLQADESLEGRAARSVHLGWQLQPATALTVQTVITDTAPGTYVATLGFSEGYFGIQELYNGNHVVIFSMWDPDQHQAEGRLIREITADEDTTVRRFGHEGTGCTTIAPFAWEVGTPVRFHLDWEDQGDGWRHVSAHVQTQNEDGEWGEWQFVATLGSQGVASGLSDVYSFVEDFRRNGESANEVRAATFSDFLYLPRMTGDNETPEWTACHSARFTADSNPDMRIDAGYTDGAFFLRTGGDTSNDTTPLRQRIRMPEGETWEAPEGLPDTHEGETSETDNG